MKTDISHEQTLQELQRVTQSEEFRNAKRLREFLTYAVTETLTGEPRNLSGYAVGIEVFDRSPDFDPQSDTLVRVSANKLRLKLDSYYHGEGKNNPVRLAMPLGGYRIAAEATLNPVSIDPHRVEVHHPVMLIEVFDCLSLNPDHFSFCRGLFSEVCLAVASGKRYLLIVPPQCADMVEKKPSTLLQDSDEADLLLTCTVRWTDTHIRLVVQLVEARNRYVVWIDAHEFEYANADLVELQTSAAAHIADSINRLDYLAFANEQRSEGLWTRARIRTGVSGTTDRCKEQVDVVDKRQRIHTRNA